MSPSTRNLSDNTEQIRMLLSADIHLQKGVLDIAMNTDVLSTYKQLITSAVEIEIEKIMVCNTQVQTTELLQANFCTGKLGVASSATGPGSEELIQMLSTEVVLLVVLNGVNPILVCSFVNKSKREDMETVRYD